ncbi:MAG: cytochrome-c peroxidase [Acidobacteria bacterium]|nr:cytochrome-c peroxidase [Acidobacteriota bacterium]
MRKTVFVVLFGAGLLVGAGVLSDAGQEPATPLGLPPVPIPDDNPQTPEKIALGEKLYNDTRFSSTGEVGCFTCHDQKKAFTDSPLKTSEGINKLTGTRNSPTVINSAYMTTQFWDGRSPDLEDQALQPFVNPVEHGLKNHDPILKIVRKDPEYRDAFKEVFGKEGKEITIRDVVLAIASFERTVISGNSPFDRWYYGGEEDAMTEQQKRGFDIYRNEGRCVSCHVIEQTQAIFTDNRFHNIGVGINGIQNDVPELAPAFLEADLSKSEVDVEVLTDPRTSELGRFAISHSLDDIGSFKTPTLRNVAVTPPYMHDGSIETLEDVVVHYMNGGVTEAGDPVNDFLSGGIRPLDLDTDQIDDLVAFMEALTSPEFEPSGADAEGN